MTDLLSLCFDWVDRKDHISLLTFGVYIAKFAGLRAFLNFVLKMSSHNCVDLFSTNALSASEAMGGETDSTTSSSSSMKSTSVSASASTSCSTHTQDIMDIIPKLSINKNTLYQRCNVSHVIIATSFINSTVSIVIIAGHSKQAALFIHDNNIAATYNNTATVAQLCNHQK